MCGPGPALSHHDALRFPRLRFATGMLGPGLYVGTLTLMQRLGYESYGAHGNDAGSMVSPELGRIDGDHVEEEGGHYAAHLVPDLMMRTSADSSALYAED